MRQGEQDDTRPARKHDQQLRDGASMRFSGVFPALVTPFGDDGELDEAALRRLVRHHVSKGVSGFYACGTTGQGVHMTVSERKRVANVVIDEAGELPVIIHVGTMVTLDAVELARHAEHIGVAAISSIIPPEFTTIEAITAYYATLTNAVAETPLIPYLMNPSVDVRALTNELLKLPRVTAAKYTGSDMHNLQWLAATGARHVDGWSVLSGMDEQCLFAAIAGAAGNIGSSVNLVPGAYRKMWEHIEAGRLHDALELQLRVGALIDTLIPYGYPAALRLALELIGLPCGEPRIPARCLSGRERESLVSDLQQIDLEGLTTL